MPVSGSFCLWPLHGRPSENYLNVYRIAGKTLGQDRNRGHARYENDSYMRIHPAVTGNPWFVCTLWLADYLIEKAQNEKEMAPALEIMKWVSDHALPSGVFWRNRSIP